ncbi:hypothetical protein E4U42_006666 [Claviceps africana]|uniref:Chitin synthase activator n=1 Tax=Claviceps africana TaxID=83212 RepID=A0A8K0NM13_9HYPO|nr:hypothetical protein E4U42_006666 [Claviceps africana]
MQDKEMANHFGATFVPGGFDDFYMPPVIAPSPQRINPQVPRNMQDDLQRLELEARDSGRQDPLQQSSYPARQSSKNSSVPQQALLARNDSTAPRATAAGTCDITAYRDDHSDRRARQLDAATDRDAPSFSPFPRVTGDNVPPADDTKEEILWNARKHVLHSQNVDMQISWARDVLIWVEIAMEAAAREPAEGVRPATPRIEHELRVDALNIIKYLAEQEHPDALYIRSEWLEFGKFGHRIDKRDAYAGYKRASELGNVRSEYRMGMLCEQSNDLSKAKEHYYQGMSLKDSAALYRMGMMSLLGQHGEPKDYVRGLERIKSAADSCDEGAPQGAYVYGMLVDRDLPDITLPDGLLTFNPDMSRMYVEKAAYLGFAKAQLKMGQAYELCQLGCEFNPSYSLHYYGLAAKQGLPEAALGVSRWFLFGYEGVFNKNEELAFKYAQQAAASKLSTGEFAMGYYYEVGIHVNQSLSDARKWYQLAADHGNKDALDRLESLRHDQRLSKQDHETTTLTRIKSQYGSQRGTRPQRFKQSQQMPTLNEAPSSHARSVSETKSSSVASRPFSRGSSHTSPQPSPGIKPTLTSDHAAFPDPSRAPVAGTHRPSAAFNIRLDGDTQAPSRSSSTAPYPEDDPRPAPLIVNRSRSSAPYPADDDHVPAEMGFGSGSGPLPSPLAERPPPSSAFGLRVQSPGAHTMPMSYSTGNLQLPAQAGRLARGRVASTGQSFQGPGADGYDAHGRYSSSQKAPSAANMVAVDRLPKQHLRQPPLSSYDPRIACRNYERFSRVPVPDGRGRPERLSSLPTHDAPPSHHSPTSPSSSGHAASNMPRPSAAGGIVTGSAPTGMPGQRPSDPPSTHSGPAAKPAAAAPAAKPNKGPATFEDMGIPRVKQEGDCIIM